MHETSPALDRFQKPLVAVVNGASRGIGREIAAQLLACDGVGRVYATARHWPRNGEEDPRLRRLEMDLAEEPSIADAADAVRRETDRVDLVINTAGLLHDGPGLQPERRLADIDPENLVRGYRVNAIGPLLVAKHFQKLFDRQAHTVFATLSARVGSIGDNRLGGWYGYRGSKAAQNMFTRNLSIELRRIASGIVCVALHPGTVDTDLSRPFQRNVPDGGLFPVERAARQLLRVIAGLGPADNGRFYAFDGEELPW